MRYEPNGINEEEKLVKKRNKSKWITVLVLLVVLVTLMFCFDQYSKAQYKQIKQEQVQQELMQQETTK